MRLPVPKNIRLNFGSTIFLGVTVFLAWQGALWPQLASITGAVYLIGGLLITGLVIGKPVTALHKRYAMKLIEGNGGELNDTIINKIRFTGTIVMLAQILIVYYGASYILQRIVV